MRAKGWLALWILGIIASVLMPTQCFAAGFALWEGSARGNALGDAVVGRADDPSAVFYDPAGITQLPGIQVMGGATGILTGGTVETPLGNQSTINEWSLDPNFYVTYQCNDRIWLGLGVFAPFGLSVSFPNDWIGAYNSYYSSVQSVDVNPNIAYKINDQLSVAAGFDAVEFGINLQQRVFVAGLPIDYSPTTLIDGDTWGYGYNLAVHYKPCQYVAMGLSYRSQVTEGGDLSSYLRGPFLGINTYSPTHATITLPDSLDMGLTFYPSDKWSWEVGATWTRWSDFQSLVFAFDRPIYGAYQITDTKDWHDTWRFKTGVEYHVTPNLDLRAGYIYDQEAIPGSFADYVLPSSNRNYFCFGPGIHFGNWSLDLSYTYVLIDGRTIENSNSPGYIPGTHLSGENASLIAGDVTYRFW